MEQTRSVSPCSRKTCGGTRMEQELLSAASFQSEGLEYTKEGARCVPQRFELSQNKPALAAGEFSVQEQLQSWLYPQQVQVANSTTCLLKLLTATQPRV